MDPGLQPAGMTAFFKTHYKYPRSDKKTPIFRLIRTMGVLGSAEYEFRAA